ncbi:hypothetical protein CR513_26781, partial [Mucuna pruriens]
MQLELGSYVDDDDILMYSHTLEEHKEHLRILLHTFNEKKLSAKPKSIQLIEEFRDLSLGVILFGHSVSLKRIETSKRRRTTLVSLSLMVGLQLYVPKDDGMGSQILGETHSSKFLVLPSATKMYQDLKKNVLVVRYEESDS